MKWRAGWLIDPHHPEACSKAGRKRDNVLPGSQQGMGAETLPGDCNESTGRGPSCIMRIAVREFGEDGQCSTLNLTGLKQCMGDQTRTRLRIANGYAITTRIPGNRTTGRHDLMSHGIQQRQRDDVVADSARSNIQMTLISDFVPSFAFEFQNRRSSYRL